MEWSKCCPNYQAYLSLGWTKKLHSVNWTNLNATGFSYSCYWTIASYYSYAIDEACWNHANQVTATGVNHCTISRGLGMPLRLHVCAAQVTRSMTRSQSLTPSLATPADSPVRSASASGQRPPFHDLPGEPRARKQKHSSWSAEALSILTENLSVQFIWDHRKSHFCWESCEHP